MYEVDSPTVVWMSGSKPDDWTVFMIKPSSPLVPLGDLKPSSVQSRSTFLWLTCHPYMRNNAVTLPYPYRPYFLDNLIIAKRNSSSLLGLAWYRRQERDMPSTKQVRRSDVFSFWRVWTTAWRTPSIVRPSALNNRGFPSKSIYQAVTLLQSSLAGHFPF